MPNEPITATEGAADAAPLLTRAVHTEPNPLQADPAAPVESELSVYLTNSTWNAIRCTGVTIVLPMGRGPQQIAASHETIAVTPPTADWDVQTTRLNTYVKYDFTPPGGSIDVEDEALHFRFAALPVNSAVGVCYPDVVEVTASGGEEPVERSASLRVPKFPVGAHGTGPTATAGLVVYPESYTGSEPPVVRVARGSKVTVAFNPAPGLARRLHWRNSDIGDQVPDGADHLECGPLYQDTSFCLQTVSEAGGETISAYDTVTVAVDVPAYTLITVPDGVVTVAQPAPLNIPGELTVATSATFDTATTVTGDLVAGTLTAPSVSAAALDFTGTVRTDSPYTTSHLEAGHLTASAGLAATGAVWMMSRAAEKLPTPCGSRVMPTDGFLASNGSDIGVLILSCSEFKAQAVNGVASVLAPVPAGTPGTWRVTCATCDAVGADGLSAACAGCSTCNALAAKVNISWHALGATR